MKKVRIAPGRRHYQLNVYLFLFGLASFAIFNNSLEACPGAIFLSELQPMPVGPRNGLRLFVYGAKSTPEAAAVPVQINPVTSDGRISFFEDDIWKANNSESTDLLLLDVEKLGRRRRSTDESLPCKGSIIWEIKDRAAAQYGYLTNCQRPWTRPSVQQLSGQPEPSRLKFEPKSHLLASPTYRYHFNSDNYMQFDKIEFARPLGWIEAARDSRLLIHADVKKFIDMNFDSEDIESKLEVSRLGPVANLARVSFYLRILFFRIDLSLSTDVGFFENSGHIPMMINIPVDAADYLNAGSGVLYNWLPGVAAVQSEVDMPIFEPELIGKGWQELSKVGHRWCSGDHCNFRYTAQVGERSFSMSFKVKRTLVDRGFFPFFVADVEGSRQAMDWPSQGPKATPDLPKRIGLYFEVSGLPKGEYPWDFWLRLGRQVNSEGQCPTPLALQQVTDSKESYR